MKKAVYLLLVVSLVVFMATAAFALPSSKASANVSSVALIKQTVGTDGWAPVLKSTIKTPNQKDLLIGASFETGLYTQTLVKSSVGVKDTSNANAQIQIKVLVDGIEANPGVVTYDKRSQTLSATLGGYFANCTDENGDGITDVMTECDLLPEEIELILDTMGAHHFNFIMANLPPGVHTIEVLAQIDSGTSTMTGSASAMGAIGKGSLTVEEIRATNAPDGIVLD